MRLFSIFLSFPYALTWGYFPARTPHASLFMANNRSPKPPEAACMRLTPDQLILLSFNPFLFPFFLHLRWLHLDSDYLTQTNYPWQFGDAESWTETWPNIIISRVWAYYLIILFWSRRVHFPRSAILPSSSRSCGIWTSWKCMPLVDRFLLPNIASLTDVSMHDIWPVLYTHLYLCRSLILVIVPLINSNGRQPLTSYCSSRVLAGTVVRPVSEQHPTLVNSVLTCYSAVPGRVNSLPLLFPHPVLFTHARHCSILFFFSL